MKSALIHQKKIQAVKILRSSLCFLEGSDFYEVNEIVNGMQKEIDDFNKSELTIINPTNKELGSIRSALKKIILPLYKGYQKNYIYELCDKTKLPQYLINAKILLSRKNPHHYAYDELEFALNESIKLEMAAIFYKQHKLTNP